MTQDEEHLRLLSIFHYVVAGLAGLFAIFPIIYVILGLMFILVPVAPEEFGGKGPPPHFIGWFFVIFGAVIMTLGWVYAGCVFTAGRFLAKRRRYLFCLVMAGVECVFIPFGTALGVFTIIVLVREPVKRLFESNDALQPTVVRTVGAGD